MLQEIEQCGQTRFPEIRAHYDQILTFPPSVEDWVGEDHPPRFISDFVEASHLDDPGFEVCHSDVGGR